MARLARIKLPSPIQLAASSRLAKSALLMLSLLVLAPLAAHAQGSPFDTGFNAIQARISGVCHQHTIPRPSYYEPILVQPIRVR
jgi:hypothetical protein